MEKILLKDFTTMGIGGEASVIRLHDEAQLESFFSSSPHTPYFILGGGSNLLVRDGAIESICLKMEIQGITWERADEGLLVTAGSGVVFDDLLALVTELSLPHGAVLSGIPGTVGAAPVQNIGAYGDEVSSYIRSIRAFDTKTMQWIELTKHQCYFAYRSSIFNTTEKYRYIITSVSFFFPYGDPLIEHREVIQAMGGANICAKDAPLLRQRILEIRHQKGMLSGDNYPKSAGSFFKNSFVSPQQFDLLKKHYPELPGFEEMHQGSLCIKLPTAWLIGQTPYVKGYVHKRVGVSPYHNLSLINCGQGSFQELMELAQLIQQCVYEKFQVRIAIEPERVEL